MMISYLLTHSETWVLCTLLHLPVQPGSLLSDWLGSGDLPASADLASESLDALAQKMYYFPASAEQPFHPMLLSSLALASVNAAEVTVIIRRVGQASMTRFAQVGNGLVQFGMDEENLALNPVTTRAEVSNKILPTWFTVSQYEGLRVELPLGAFLLFKQACVRADLAAAESGFKTKTFKKSDFLEQFTFTTAWVDVFNAEGVRGVLSIDQMPLEDYFNLLVSMGYIQETVADALEIGEAGKPLAAALSDADLCTLTASLQTWEGEFPETGVFLHGAGRLFLLKVGPGNVIIQQLESQEAGRIWVENLLSNGSRAHYANYAIPLAPGPANQPADATLIESKPVLAKVVFLSGVLANQRFPLGDQLRLGREADNDLTLPDIKVSRHHAIIRRQGIIYQIIDLNSGNGTYVNGQRIAQPTPLKNGDIVLIGDTKLTISDQL